MQPAYSPHHLAYPIFHKIRCLSTANANLNSFSHNLLITFSNPKHNSNSNSHKANNFQNKIQLHLYLNHSN